MPEEKVDPEYFKRPLHELVRLYGYEWLREQDKLFNKIYGSIKHG